MKKIFLLLAICIGIIYFFLGQKWAGKLYDSNVSKFNKAEFAGTLQSVFSKNHGTGIRLVNGEEYVFFPRKDELLNAAKRFDDFAEKGDSVYKKSLSDTLFLIKNEKVYKYVSIGF